MIDETELHSYALDHTDAFSLLAYLLSSAEGCMKEPPIYGVYRLSTAALNLARVWEPRADPETAVLLRDLQSRWEGAADLLRHDPEKLREFLVESNNAVARGIRHLAEESR